NAPQVGTGRGPQQIQVPTLYIHGREDGCIGVELADGMEAFLDNGLRKVIFEGAGHFVHQEKPDEVNRVILEFLE
ncbi:MAG: alpha/beta hydrolase, partial [Acidobacteriota bacterium]|nr:alpha/beta hydrolase [Acidobacteriota bacterium]